MKDKDELIKNYYAVNDALIDEVEVLKHLLSTELISSINLLGFHYKIKDLLFKRNQISNELLLNYDLIIIDEF